MHPYLPHLLTDIADACRSEIPPEFGKPQTIEDELEDMEKWVFAKEPQHTFGYYCGLNAENFPPAHQLTDDEMIIIRKAFEHMMFTWNQGIDLPENLPVAFAYKMIVDSLKMKTTIVNSGGMSFDFCSGYAPDCVFKEYCSCLKYWNNPLDVDVLSFPDDKVEWKDSLDRPDTQKDISEDEEDDFPF